MPYLETSVGKLYFSDHRKADSSHVPVIWVHGAGGSRLDWPKALRRLPEANAIVLDLPGHGNSNGPGRDRVENYAEVVLALMDGLDLPEAIIGGQSMGGAITQMMGLTYPERVAGLILVATGAKLSVHPDILQQTIHDKATVAKVLSQWYWGDTATDAMRQGTYNQIMAIDAQTIHDDYAACNRFDVRERLSEITLPTLIIGGTDDKMTFHKYSEYLHEHIANSTLVSVDGAGHMVVLEFPEVVAEAVREWLLNQVKGT